MLPDRLNDFCAPMKVLDHGFVRVVDVMGENADEAVVQAARVSYGEGTKTVNEDRGLIRYLLRHHHTTPFEMAEVKFHIKLPIFVARQWIRHRTANVNEYSARYSIMRNEFYVPDVSVIAGQSETNKQGRENGPTTEDQREFYRHFRDYTSNCNDERFEDYDHFVDKDQNLYGLDISRELARINLPLGTYTEMYWKIDLHNLLHFLKLRADGHAQYEIRVYADAMLEFVKVWAPYTYEAFQDYVAQAKTFSRSELEILRRLLSEDSTPIESARGFLWKNESMRMSKLKAVVRNMGENLGLSKRELKEFYEKIGVKE